MSMFEALARNDHEQVIYCHDSHTGLRAILCIHNTVLGPAVGGARMLDYRDEQEALADGLRLSRTMTYKAALAGLNLGGGKTVILGDPRRDKSEAMLRAYGRFVQSLGGRYFAAEDVGTTVRDMEIVRMETDFVTGISRSLGGSGDPSPVTALGVFEGIRASAQRALQAESMRGIRVAVQGVGHVGFHLCQHLHRDGAQLTVADPDPERVRAVVEQFEAKAVAPDEIYDVECEVLAPCALGGVLDDRTIPRLACQIVAGAANNQLADEARHAQALADRGILYAPDYVINAGGLINVANELEGYDRERAVRKTASISESLVEIFGLAERHGVTTVKAANTLAERRLVALERVKRTYLGVPRGRHGRGVL